VLSAGQPGPWLQQTPPGGAQLTSLGQQVAEEGQQPTPPYVREGIGLAVQVEYSAGQDCLTRRRWWEIEFRKE